MFTTNCQKTVAEVFGLVSPKGDVGIEIETEGMDLRSGRITQAFTGKEDGSLRQGMEYISKPLLLKDVELRVNNLHAQIAALGGHLNPTYRSSTHIHVNYCDRTLWDVAGTMVLWSLVEPTVMRLMPPGRDGSLFCVASYDAGELPEWMDQFCSDIAENFPNGFRPRGKYSSLNVTRLGHGHDAALGTMEYRVFPSCMDGAQITQWCSWLLNIREMATSSRNESYVDIVRWAEQNPLPFLNNILGGIPQHIQKDAAEYVDFGARTAFEMARVISKYVNMKPKKKRKGDMRSPDFAIIDDILPVGEPVPEPEPVGVHIPWNAPFPDLRADIRVHRR